MKQQDQKACTHTCATSRAPSTHERRAKTNQQQSITTNERGLVGELSVSDRGRKTRGVLTTSVPTCHLRPVLAELMRGLGPHAQPWDRHQQEPTTPPLQYGKYDRGKVGCGPHAEQKPHGLSTCKGMRVVCLAIPL